MITMNTKYRLTIVISSFALLIFQANAVAQEANSENTMTLGKNGKSPTASIADMAWIAGHWQGDAIGGQFEETWNPPMAGEMMGMFKHSKDGEISFYEFLTIVEHDNSLLMRFKHFDKSLHGWEEKDDTIEFRLVKVTDTEMFFEGLTFRKVDSETMHVFVVVGGKDNKSRELKFACKRAK